MPGLCAGTCSREGMEFKSDCTNPVGCLSQEAVQGALGKTLMAGLQIQLCCCRIFGSSGELSNKFILVLWWWLSSFLSILKQRQKETLFKQTLQWLRLKPASFRGGNGGWIEIVYRVIITGAWPQHWTSTQLLSFYSKFDENGNHKMKAEVVWILPQKPEVNK